MRQDGGTADGRIRELEELLALATRVKRGEPTGSPGPGVQLRPGEHPLLELSGIDLVEVPEAAGSTSLQTQIGLSWFQWARTGQRPTLSQQHATVVDTGNLTVTDQRVVFHGRTQTRQWDHEEVVAYSPDDSRSRMMFHLSGRPTPIGFGHRGDDGGHLEWRIALALALYRGDDRFIEDLRSELDRLRASASDGETTLASTGADDRLGSVGREWTSTHSSSPRRTFLTVEEPLLGSSGALTNLWSRLSSTTAGFDVPRIMTLFRASLWRRAAARFLDVFIAAIPMSLLDSALKEPTATAAAESDTATAAVVLFFALIVGMDILLIAGFGATIGKWAFGIMVVDTTSGETPTFTKSTLRALVAGAFGISIIGAAAVFLRLLGNPNSVAPHDRWARTAVARRARRGASKIAGLGPP